MSRINYEKDVTPKETFFGWCTELQDVVDTLNTFTLTEWENGFMKSLPAYGERHGFVTQNQMRSLGGMSKKYIQNGEYVAGDWWDGTIQRIKFQHEGRPNLEGIQGYMNSENRTPTSLEFETRYNELQQSKMAKHYDDQIKAAMPAPPPPPTGIIDPSTKKGKYRKFKSPGVVSCSAHENKHVAAVQDNNGDYVIQTFGTVDDMKAVLKDHDSEFATRFRKKVND